MKKLFFCLTLVILSQNAAISVEVEVGEDGFIKVDPAIRFEAVLLEFDSEEGCFYQPQISPNLQDWDNEGYAVQGTGGRLELAVSSRDFEEAYFRVVATNSSDNTQITNQPGTIVFSVSPVPPVGYLACNGQAVSKEVYGRLWDALGGESAETIWGDGGDGTGPLFNLPDTRGRVLLGAYSAADFDPALRPHWVAENEESASASRDISERPLGDKGGEEEHIMSESELAEHQHFTFDDSSPRGGRFVANDGGGAFKRLSGGNTNNIDYKTGKSGSNKAFNVMQPYLAIAVYIKY